MTVNEITMSLELGLIYGIVAIGIYITFRIIDFPDLTCDGSFVLGAAISAILIKLGINPFLSLIAAACIGCLAGISTGVLYTKFRVTDLLAGILVGFMLYSVNLRIMGGIPNINLISDNTIFYQDTIIILGSISIIISLIIGYIIMTDFGLALRSIGQNKRLAQNSGVNIKSMTIIGLGLSNSIIALGGALFSQHQGFADVGSGTGTVITGLASLMIGEKLAPNRSIFLQIFSCLIGSIVYRMLISFALHANSFGLNTSDLNLVTGLMIIFIIYTQKRRNNSYAKA